MNEWTDLVGNTPLLRTDWTTAANVFAKVEYVNLAGSIKDRVAKAIIEDAERTGKLKTGGTVIEATSGNTGIGLASVAALKGYRCIIVMPETMSIERRKLIQGYGAEIVLTDGKSGMRGAVERAKTLSDSIPNAILAGQFDNPVCVTAHYQTTAKEIWEQTQGKVDIFVAGIGTGGTITGVGKFLKERNPNVRIIGVEPAASPLLTKGVVGAHKIQGIGANFIPAILDRTILDEVLTVTDEEAFERARTLGKKGLFVGISSGAAAQAAISVAKRRENAGKNIVVILPDGGGRYLSTPLLD